MSIFKWIGILSIAAGCIGVGIDWTSALRVRISTLRAMEQSLHLFRGFTETYRLPLGIVCQKISEQVDAPVNLFYSCLSESFIRQDETQSSEIWKRTIECMGRAFDKEDQMLFLQIGDFIGVQNLDIQKQVLNLCLEQIQERICLLETDRPQKEKLYRVLSLTAGGFLIVLFL